jgi:hypothetical protein
MGAVVSEYFVLTAAHCFMVDDQKHSIKVSVGKDAVKTLTSRPIYLQETLTCYDL